MMSCKACFLQYQAVGPMRLSVAGTVAVISCRDLEPRRGEPRFPNKDYQGLFGAVGGC